MQEELCMGVSNWSGGGFFSGGGLEWGSAMFPELRPELVGQ